MTGKTATQQDQLLLISTAKKGNRKAMGQLIERELPWIKAVISGYISTPDVVDDLCQETFISAWRNITKLRNPKGFRSWLYTIAVNKVRSFLRNKHKRRAHPLDENLLSADPAAVETGLEKQEFIQAALNQLEPKYRDPLIIFYFHGKSCEETGRTLGLKPSTTRIRLLRGREKMREILAREGTL